MPFLIHKLDANDLLLARQLFSVFEQAFEEPAGPVPDDAYVLALLNRPDFHAFVALDQGQVIGGVTAYELPMFPRRVTELFLYDVAVAASHQRLGVAAALIDTLKALCSQRGISTMFVGTDTGNAAALRLYQASGGVADEEIAWFNYTLGE